MGSKFSVLMIHSWEIMERSLVLQHILATQGIAGLVQHQRRLVHLQASIPDTHGVNGVMIRTTPQVDERLNNTLEAVVLDAALRDKPLQYGEVSRAPCGLHGHGSWNKLAAAFELPHASISLVVGVARVVQTPSNTWLNAHGAPAPVLALPAANHGGELRMRQEQR